MRVAIAQLNLHVGNIDANVSRIRSSLGQAKNQGADLVLFPELTLAGYPPRDLLLSQAFIDDCQRGLGKVAASCHDIAAIIGGPSRNGTGQGKPLFNSAFLLYDGKVQAVCHKGLLPTYDVFNEDRYFQSATDFGTVDYKGERLAITVCEDLWNIGKESLYALTPPDVLMKSRPTVLLNISASPFAWNHMPQRMRVLSANAKKYRLPLFSANLVGGQTDLLFDGASAVFGPSGQVVDRLPAFREDLRVYDLSSVRSSPHNEGLPELEGKEQQWAATLDALVMGVRDYFRKTGLSKALVGLSGGLDSALTLVIAEKALGKENVWAVLLPGPYSSEHSVTDALALARKLGVRHDTISINGIVESLENSLAAQYAGTESGIAEENLQARARAVVLMGLSNKFNHLLLNTSNKSEAAVGYTTLYGDMCGGLSVLGDVYKSDVYGMARLINAAGEVIPWHTISKPPSAELKPNQKDSDSLPEYQLLDDILYQFLEEGKDAGEIVRRGHDEALVKRVIEMVCLSEHKRFQSPPILRTSPKCLGVGREMPLEASWQSLLRIHNA